MTVKRYDMEHEYSLDINVLPTLEAEGAFVRYDDYAGLLKERDAVVAESACLKQSIDEIAEAMETGTDGALFTAIDEAISLCTPATESVLARIQAQGVDMAISKLESSKYGDEGDLAVLLKYAAELRKGVGK